MARARSLRDRGDAGTRTRVRRAPDHRTVGTRRVACVRRPTRPVTAAGKASLHVVVADDDPRVREDFTALLDLEPDITVVGTAAGGAAAIEVASRLVPHVVVMDVRMPGRNGIDATRALRRRHGDRCRVLVVTTFDLDEYVLGAVRAGAAGFLLKDQAPDLLAPAVRTVA